MRSVFIRHLLQEVADAVQSRTLFIHALNDPPGRIRDMGPAQHLFFGFGIIFPAAATFQVHRAEFPLLQRIVNTAQKAQFLLLVRNGKPVFDDLNTAAGQHFFKFRHATIELLDVSLTAKAHHPFHARPVVPAPVEQHHFPGGGQMSNVTLEIPLGFFAVVRCWQGGNPAGARVKALRDAFDNTAFTGGVAAFEQNDQPMAGAHHPVLKLNQFALQVQQFAKIATTPGLLIIPVRRGLAKTQVVEFHLQFFIVAVVELL
ncbi:hypothetical protein PAJ_0556 [Pantoea ananatis AJ13355]|nr:hypothetical protein PAJ_0556 [Pantoea ananatis AJ13355]